METSARAADPLETDALANVSCLVIPGTRTLVVASIVNGKTTADKIDKIVGVGIALVAVIAAGSTIELTVIDEVGIVLTA